MPELTAIDRVCMRLCLRALCRASNTERLENDGDPRNILRATRLPRLCLGVHLLGQEGGEGGACTQSYVDAFA